MAVRHLCIYIGITIGVEVISPLEFSEYSVHDPIGRSAAVAVAGADRLLLQVFDDELDERQLYMGWIGDDDFLPALFIVQADGLVGIDGEAELSFVANEFDTVFFGRLMSHEAPRSRAGQSALEAEAGAHGIFCLIEAAAVGAIALGFDNGSEDVLQQVELVGREVIEVSASSDIRLDAPGEVGPVVIEVARRYRKSDLHIDDRADTALVHQLLDALEVGQISSVVGYKTRYVE